MRRLATTVFCVVAASTLLAVACAPAATPAGAAPVADLRAAPTAGPAPLGVAFSGAFSTGTTLSWAWDFGDGSTATGSHPNHTYQTVGAYTAELVVTDNRGRTSTATQQIEVLPDTSSVVLVDDSGADSPTCGASGAPCATIGYGVGRAASESKTEVWVAEGTYAAFAVTSGVDVRGGYDASFITTGGDTVVNGAFNAGAGVSAAVVAVDVNAPTTIHDLRAVGADEMAAGRTALGVYVGGSTDDLTLNGLDVEGGLSGAAAMGLLVDGPSTVNLDSTDISSGTPGGAGTSAYGLRAVNGAVVNIEGGSVTAEPGVAGSNGGTAPAAPATGCAGGAGANASGPSSPGNGGTACTNIGARSSGAGGRGGDYSSAGLAGGAGGGGASGGNGGCGSTFGCGTDPSGGSAGANGTAGAGGTGATDALGSGSVFLGQSGAAGTPGTDGTGGGGGGGGKSASASGGGGGAGGGGGLGGSAASTGGSPGGGSFGIFAVDSSVDASGVVVTAYSGGVGGKGQPGGPGGSGGSGGAGGNKSCCEASGGGGGGGGGAGAGGGGAGGGAGGPSIAVMHRGTGSLTRSGGSVYAATPAAGGAGGAGGVAGAGGAGGAPGNCANGGCGPTAGGSPASGTSGAAGSAGAAGQVWGVWDNGSTGAPDTGATTTTSSSTTTTVANNSSYTPVAKTCKTTASGQTRYNANPTGATVLAPASVAQGSTFQVELTPDPMSVPTSGEGYPISWVANVYIRFGIPAGTSFVSATLSGGANLGSGTPTVAQSGGKIVLSVPGQLSPGISAVFPKITVTLQATGASGSTATLKYAGTSYGDPSMSFQTRVTNVPVLGSVVSSSNCFPDSPNPVLGTIAIN
jgi:PKD repeat protein